MDEAKLSHMAKELQLYAQTQASQVKKSSLYFSLVNIVEVMTVISALTVVIGIAAGLLNRRIEDTNKRIDELEQEIKEIRREFKEELREVRREFREELRDIRQLLYRVLEVPHKEEE